MSPPFLARASTIKVFRRCPRRWRFGVDTPEPGSPAQAIGTAVHLELEQWLRDGKPFSNTKEGRIAKLGLPHLPPPRKELEVEISFEHPDGIRGTIDLFDPTEPRLYDHKTSSNPTCYALTEKELLADVQANIYAKVSFDKLAAIGHPVDTLKATWIYYPKNGGPAVVREVVFNRTDVEAHWAEAVDDKLRMEQALTVEANVLSPNRSACNDYFKQCPFFAACKKGEEDTTMGSSENLFANMKRAAAAQTPAAAPAAQVQPSRLSILEKMQAGLELSDVPAGLAAAAPAPSKLEQDLRKSIELYTTGIVPPDAPEATLEAMPQDEPKKKPPRTAKAAPAPQTLTPVPAPTFELWIGAMRDGQAHIKAEMLVGPVADRVCAANGLDYYSLAEYGKGAGLLCAAFQRELELSPPTLPVFVDRVPNGLAKAVLEILVRKAGSNILRGV